MNVSAGLRPLLQALDRASYHDFSDRGDPVRRQRKLSIVVAGVALSALMLELLLTRLFPFFLGDISAFAAIPIAMFGLSLGALALHWHRGEPDPRWLTWLVPLLLVLMAASLVGAFALFDHVFNLTHHWKQNPRTDALKTAALSGIFVPAFAVAGLILSTAFTAGARQVGRLYSLDLAGSAAACAITPVLLWALDLRYTCALLLVLLAWVCAEIFTAWRRALRRAIVAGGIGLLGLAASGVVFVAHPDPEVLGGRYSDDAEAREVRHGWNHVSRVALMQFIKPDGDKYHWVVHDDGISNVRVVGYVPSKEARGSRRTTTQIIPSLMDEPSKTAFVMFAGCGKDMVELMRYARGDLSVRGVEINGLVKRVVTPRGEDPWRLREFYDRPEVDLRIAEGRGFMDRDRDTYDAIFVATNGAQHAARTGHARKFLDTREAMEAYIDHLAPGGVIVFNHQRVDHKIEAFKRILQDRGLAPFEEAAALIGRKRGGRRVDVLVVKPSGLSETEVERLAERWPKRKAGKKGRFLKYAPGHEADAAMTELAKRPPVPERFVPTDDRPYQQPLDWSGFVLRPSEEQLEDVQYSLDWIKVFTVLLFSGLALLCILLFVVRKRGDRRLPVWLMGYFLLTGVCYMTAQIGLMAKLELFMGRPLYAIAVVLAAFLLMNGAGSAWVGRRTDAGRPPRVVLLALAAAGATVLTLLLADGVLVHLLWLPPLLKAPLAFVALAPLAFVLGAFYPTGVGMAVERGMQAQVPFTFGLATLSSVLGSTYAMVEVINLGFRAMVAHAIVGYLVLALFAGVASVVRR